MQINYMALIVGTVLAIVFSAIYYYLLNKKVVAIRTAAAKQTKSKNVEVETTLTPNKLIVEFVRTFVTGLVIAYAVHYLLINNTIEALYLSFWLWLGFPVVLLVGSVIHEHFPPKLAAIHAFDWLVKIVIFCLILALWR